MRVNALDGVEFMSRRLTFGKARVKRYEAPFPGGCVAAYRMLRKAMINRIKLFFSAQNDGAGVESLGSEIQMAVAALMVETALGDGNFGEDERARIERLVGRRFGLEGEAARRLVGAAAEMADNANQILSFTRTVKDRFSEEERIAVMEMLWEVAYADGDLHDYEAHLLRRIGGLIYVSDRDRGEARKRVLARLKLAP